MTGFDVHEVCFDNDGTLLYGSYELLDDVDLVEAIEVGDASDANFELPYPLVDIQDLLE